MNRIKEMICSNSRKLT